MIEVTKPRERTASGQFVGRENRASAIAGERKRRKESTIDRLNAGKKIDFLEASQLDQENYTYRWIVDDGGNRLKVAWQSDYDFVATSEIKDFNPEAMALTGESSERMSVHSGTNKAGQSERAYLMKKPKVWFEDDMQERIDRRTDLMKGVVNDGDASRLGPEGTGLYKVGNTKLGDAARRVGPAQRK